MIRGERICSRLNHLIGRLSFAGLSMSSMMVTVWLIISAPAFGAVVGHGSFISRLIDPALRRVRSDGGRWSEPASPPISLPQTIVAVKAARFA
jgi:hypothetical protein